MKIPETLLVNASNIFLAVSLNNYEICPDKQLKFSEGQKKKYII